MSNMDIVLKWIMAFGVVAYLLCLEKRPMRRWVSWVGIGILLVGVNLLLWHALKVGIIALLIGNILGFMLIRGIYEFWDERLGRQQLRRFEQNRSALVRAIMNKQEVFLILTDGTEHRFYPHNLIQYGVCVIGTEGGETKQYGLEDIQEVRL